MKVASILKYPGGKWSIVDHILEHFPCNYQNLVYCEPFFGSGAVFFNKLPSAIEMINDLDGRVVNLFRVIREQPQQLAALINITPWSRQEYELSYQVAADPLEDARRFLVRCWQAIGSKTSDRTGWRSDKKTGQRGTTNPRMWAKLPDKILAIAERLKDAQIENRPAMDIIKRYRNGDVLLYVDPPYILSTRSKRMYAYEMTDQDHIELLDALLDHPGPVLISGYENPIYTKKLAGWRKYSFVAYAETGGARTEVLWQNPICGDLVKPKLF